jgi:hypothetical protein
MKFPNTLKPFKITKFLLKTTGVIVSLNATGAIYGFVNPNPKMPSDVANSLSDVNSYPIISYTLARQLTTPLEFGVNIRHRVFPPNDPNKVANIEVINYDSTTAVKAAEIIKKTLAEDGKITQQLLVYNSSNGAHAIQEATNSGLIDKNIKDVQFVSIELEGVEGEQISNFLDKLLLKLRSNNIEALYYDKKRGHIILFISPKVYNTDNKGLTRN